MAVTQTIELTLAHSPDPDDAFMWWPLTGRDQSGESPQIETGPFRFRAELLDIETLNTRALEGRYEITGISAAHYPAVCDRYAITSCGASMGVGYGPKLVSRQTMTLDEIARDDFPIAVPGQRTTAALLAAMMLELKNDRARVRPAPFDEIIDRIRSGEFAAGVVIHEGQLTFEQHGLHLIADLGTWWHERFDLPLPLGLNVIRRDLESMHGRGTLASITGLLHGSILHALAHREAGVAYAGRFGRGITAEQADRFVGMYVNDLTLDCGAVGERAIRTLLDEAWRRGLVPRPMNADIMQPQRH